MSNGLYEWLALALPFTPHVSGYVKRGCRRNGHIRNCLRRTR